MATARDIAFTVLLEHRETGRRASELLERAAGQSSRDDVRLASEIVYTTIRRCLTLDALVAAHVKRPREQVERDLWTLLQVGACQIALMETAEHAAVHETVETGRRCGNSRWTGFVNGALRAIARTAGTGEFAAGPAANHVPIAPGRYRVLTRDLFPDPRSVDYVSQAFGYPPWLVARWSGRMPHEEVLRQAAFFNSAPRMTLRVNRIRGDRATLLEALADQQIDAEASHVGEDGVVLSRRAPVPSLPGFAEGLFAVQDESAMAASELLAPEPGQRVLDLCAGSGSKTCHLAAIMQNTGSIVAVDNNNDRLSRLQENADRLGIDIIEAVNADASGGLAAEGGFDCAIVDVPCSNTGVLGKRPEVRWRLKPEELPELVQLQLKLLGTAVEAVRPGGSIVYSTCSCEPDENQLLVGAYQQIDPRLRLESEQHHIPGKPGDGAYQARLIRV